VANLRAHGVQLHGAALLLGAGGAARAIGAALLEAGMVVTIANRTQARAQALADALPGLQVVAWEMRGAAIADCDLLVNTTSLGMQGHDALQIDLRRAHAGLTVADIVYAPAETALLADARARGLKAVPGLGMLLHQAVPGFAAWFGIVPAVDEEVIAAVNAGS
jgi:shikimate dehydrogenase